MASIAVAFPLFLGVMRTILGDVERDAERLRSGVRKWLTYIALLITAGGIVGDLIWFLDQFLVGGLTSPFGLKAFTVLFICSAILLYYFWSLRWNDDAERVAAKRRSLRFAVPVVAFVAVSLMVGFGVAGTPGEQRKVEADLRRIENLRTISRELHSWYQGKAVTDAKLPPKLSALTERGVDERILQDPETGEQYGYALKVGGEYELCANFAARSERQGSGRWYHGAGHTCFPLDASTKPLR